MKGSSYQCLSAKLMQNGRIEHFCCGEAENALSLTSIQSELFADVRAGREESSLVIVVVKGKLDWLRLLPNLLRGLLGC